MVAFGGGVQREGGSIRDRGEGARWKVHEMHLGASIQFPEEREPFRIDPLCAIIELTVVRQLNRLLSLTDDVQIEALLIPSGIGHGLAVGMKSGGAQGHTALKVSEGRAG